MQQKILVKAKPIPALGIASGSRNQGLPPPSDLTTDRVMVTPAVTKVLYNCRMLQSILRAAHKPVYDYRLKALVRFIAPHLKPGFRVLDVGCGHGQLGNALMSALNRTITVEGLESVKRGGELIQVTVYSGTEMPWPDETFDAVILADVLHHDRAPERLLKESVRVSREIVVIKDHVRNGLLAQQRISLLDWAANAGYDVPCTYRYNSLEEWHRLIRGVAAKILEEHTSMDIYPMVLNQLLGKGLQYFVVFARQRAKGR